MNIRSFIDLLLPAGACMLCAASSGRAALCDACSADLPTPECICPRCGLPRPGSGETAPCPACVAAPPPQQETLTGCVYTWPVDRMIRAYKDEGRLALGRALVPALVHQLAEPGGPDLVTEVPVSAAGLGQRGFDQSRLLARWVAQETGLKHAPGLLRRTRGGPPQRGLDRRRRLANLHGAFQVRRPLAGAHVALVDDVITTGATVAEASRVLLDAGAARVSVWGLARAPRLPR